MKGAKLIYRWDHYTWPELRVLVPNQPVVVLPVGSTEDHGHHLPLDVDTFVLAADAAVGNVLVAVGERVTPLRAKNPSRTEMVAELKVRGEIPAAEEFFRYIVHPDAAFQEPADSAVPFLDESENGRDARLV